MSQVAKRLFDDDTWIRQNAIGADAEYGSRATQHLEALKSIQKSSDEQLRKSAATAIKKISGSGNVNEAAAEQMNLQKKIKTFISSRN